MKFSWFFSNGQNEVKKDKLLLLYLCFPTTIIVVFHTKYNCWRTKARNFMLFLSIFFFLLGNLFHWLFSIEKVLDTFYLLSFFCWVKPIFLLILMNINIKSYIISLFKVNIAWLTKLNIKLFQIWCMCLNKSNQMASMEKSFFLSQDEGLSKY